MYYAGLVIVPILSLFGGDNTKDSKAAKRASLLSPEDSALYKKIVKDLLRSYQSGSALSNPSKSYAVVFRQPASWEPIRHDLLAISVSPSIKDSNVRNWNGVWQRIIDLLSKSQKKVHDCGLLIMKSQPGDSAIADYKKEIAGENKKIKAFLRSAEKILYSNIVDPKLTNYKEVVAVLNYLNTHWEELKVFSEWTEVNMDSDALCVQVQPPEFRQRIDSMIFNPSTKGIFWVKEMDDNSEQIGLDSYQLPPDEQSTPRLTRRASSSLKLDEEVFLSCEVLKHGEKLQPDQHIKQSELGDRLHKIVTLALDEVNRSVANSQGRTNLLPPSSETVGPRWDFALIFGPSTRY